jgi:hypothetical protein
LKDSKKINEISNLNIMTLSEQRQIAKAGMVGSMGGLFATGFIRSKAARILHPWLGWALLGFSIWHHIVSKHQKKY